MTDKPNRPEIDEAYMQDAIEAAKATGALHEVNPKDAPARVTSSIATQPRKDAMPKSTPDASVTAEDKGFSHLEKLRESRAAAADKPRER